MGSSRCSTARTWTSPPGRRLQRVPLLELVPRSFGDYEAAGGGRGLQTALAAWPVAVTQEVARSGLRGRGGAGFPTGEKWRAGPGGGGGGERWEGAAPGGGRGGLRRGRFFFLWGGEAGVGGVTGGPPPLPRVAR